MAARHGEVITENVIRRFQLVIQTIDRDLAIMIIEVNKTHKEGTPGFPGQIRSA